ncbi:MAG: hypothetical protein HYY61_02685 [Deltaproteobacteria bacterium]|nr:hypothetical protein [Deltaproteobacteria bacterium]
MKSVLCFVMLFVMGIALPLKEAAATIGIERDRREEAAINRMIPPLAVTAAPQGQTPLDDAFVLSKDIGNLQTRLQTLERQIENHKRDAHRAGTQRDYRKRNTYLAAAKQAEVEAQKIRDQIAQKESERHAKVEEVRRLGLSAYSNVADAIHLNDIARDETMGNAMRRLDPAKVRGAAAGARIPEELWPLSKEFADDEVAMGVILKDARVGRCRSIASTK